jgi:solute carrier family 7 (L-type amino acid transporter), member 9/15
LGKAAGLIFAILICLVIAGALNGNIFVTGRLTVAAANHNYLPSFLRNVGSFRAKDTGVRDSNVSKQEDGAPLYVKFLPSLEGPPNIPKATP